MSRQTVIVGAARTPIGGLSGDLASCSAVDLGAVAIKAVVERAGLGNSDIQGLGMGCVLPAGLGQAPARQAALKAGLVISTLCFTKNKMCGSGMESVMHMDTQIRAGDIDVAVAGGMESMTNAPYMLPKARGGYRFGHDKIWDHMAQDGLEDPANGDSMGICAEEVIDKNPILTRELIDQYAIESLEFALRAQRDGDFDAEIVPVTRQTRKGEVVVDSDEQPRNARPDKIPALKPTFRKDGRLTPANSSSISDGAAALALMEKSVAEQRGIKPLARIVAQAVWAGTPREFSAAPSNTLKLLLEKTGWSVEDVDLFEFNEAFATVPMLSMREFNIPRDKMNVNGGACALGHPIGCSGTRIIVTLVHALQRRNLKRGIAAICLGGGEATGLAIELV